MKAGAARSPGPSSASSPGPLCLSSAYSCCPTSFACIRFPTRRRATSGLGNLLVKTRYWLRGCGDASLLLRLFLVYPFRYLTVLPLLPPPSPSPPLPARPPHLLPLRRRPLPLLPMPDFANPEQACRGDDGREEREPGRGVERGVQAGVDGRERSRALCDAIRGRGVRERERDQRRDG